MRPPPIAADRNGRRCGRIGAGDHVAAAKSAVALEAGSYVRPFASMVVGPETFWNRPCSDSINLGVIQYPASATTWPSLAAVNEPATGVSAFTSPMPLA